MNGGGRTAAYRIEDLSRLSGTTVRTIRAYTDRGLLPRPERSGRANVYDDTHLTRLRRIAGLLGRGYTLASIGELLAAWDAGTGLGGVLGLVDEVDRGWSDEAPGRVTLAELAAAFGGVADPATVRDALELGILEPVPGSQDEFAVPSPQELAVAVELHAAGVPLSAISGHLREVRGQVEHISERFLRFTTEYVFRRFLDHPPTDAEAEEATGLVRRLRPLARQTLDAELARAMGKGASEAVRRHLGAVAVLPDVSGAGPVPVPVSQPEPGNGQALRTGARPGPRFASEPGSELPAGPEPSLTGSRGPGEGQPEAEGSGGSGGSGQVTVVLPAGTVDAVRGLVGAEGVVEFLVAAAEREVAARRMDALAAGTGAGRPPAGRGTVQGGGVTV
ncbi:MerR family transcriptional regulator [Streptomyces sp. KK5PA1]|uniref:MerR family transcriptional regulator n=1 Tax=Actinacidiphila acididurans TaxID=2784346 RepID=A0ABS2TRP7_9ACTN|nr:MerR family transcriptional regulator [Actinacidiphila acididurans]MBM9506008.1 MerR family transcriptional regulator [Actinacidiphila acididurans]